MPTPLAVYCGPVAGAAPYFEGLGYALPLHQNPADAFLDICSGAVLRAGQVGSVCVRTAGLGRHACSRCRWRCQEALGRPPA